MLQESVDEKEKKKKKSETHFFVINQEATLLHSLRI